MCFICLQTYVVSVLCGCFKSRSAVSSPSSLSVTSPRCLLLLPAPVRHPPCPSPFSMLVALGVVWAPCGHAKRHANDGTA
jgi:hypothetical protein